jgi:heme/copper-type cytochrome/quinol oxidase subunit 2
MAKTYFGNDFISIIHDLFGFSLTGFPEAANEQMASIITMYHNTTITLMFITVVIGLTIFTFVTETFSSTTNNYPRNFSKWEESWIDLLVVFMPIIIIYYLTVPAVGFLLNSDRLLTYGQFASITVEIVGHQWYWTYYLDFVQNQFILDLLLILEYDASLVGDYYNDMFDLLYDTSLYELEIEQYMDIDAVDTLRYLDVTEVLVLPRKTIIRCIISADDVIHSWALPQLGIKVDAVPGRLNMFILYCVRTGTYYGQCSELCGVNHAFMPICVEFVNVDLFFNWYYQNIYMIRPYKFILSIYNFDVNTEVASMIFVFSTLNRNIKKIFYKIFINKYFVLQIGFFKNLISFINGEHSPIKKKINIFPNKKEIEIEYYPIFFQLLFNFRSFILRFKFFILNNIELSILFLFYICFVINIYLDLNTFVECQSNATSTNVLDNNAFDNVGIENIKEPSIYKISNIFPSTYILNKNTELVDLYGYLGIVLDYLFTDTINLPKDFTFLSSDSLINSEYLIHGPRSYIFLIFSYEYHLHIRQADALPLESLSSLLEAYGHFNQTIEWGPLTIKSALNDHHLYSYMFWSYWAKKPPTMEFIYDYRDARHDFLYEYHKMFDAGAPINLSAFSNKLHQTYLSRILDYKYDPKPDHFDNIYLKILNNIPDPVEVRYLAILYTRLSLYNNSDCYFISTLHKDLIYNLYHSSIRNYIPFAEYLYSFVNMNFDVNVVWPVYLYIGKYYGVHTNNLLLPYSQVMEWYGQAGLHPRDFRDPQFLFPNKTYVGWHASTPNKFYEAPIYYSPDFAMDEFLNMFDPIAHGYVRNYLPDYIIDNQYIRQVDFIEFLFWLHYIKLYDYNEYRKLVLGVSINTRSLYFYVPTLRSVNIDPRNLGMLIMKLHDDPNRAIEWYKKYMSSRHLY